MSNPTETGHDHDEAQVVPQVPTLPEGRFTRAWFAVDLPSDTHGADDILSDTYEAIGESLAGWDDLRDYDTTLYDTAAEALEAMEQDLAATLPRDGRAITDGVALDRLSEILTTGGEPWPSGADFIEWAAEIVAATGRSAE